MINNNVYKMVALFLGIVLVIGVVGMVVLAVLSKEIPDPIKILVTSDLTGLLGLLVHPTSEGEK
jgi:hypothetical protein